MIKKAFFPAILMMIALAVYPAAARASNEGPVQMAVTVGYDGKYVLGKTTPVLVTVKNPGREMAGELELRTGAGFTLMVRRHVVLPQNTEKQFVLFVQPSGLYTAKDFEVQLKSGGATVTAAVPKSIKGIDPDKSLCGILSGDPGAIGYFKKILFNQTTLKDWVELPADGLHEDAALLESFSLLVINRLDAGKMSEKQTDAVRQWVYAGGTLILGTGPGRDALGQWKELAGGLEFKGTATESDLESLSKLALGREIQASLPILDIRSDGWAEPARTTAGKPLILNRAFGKGAVYVTAFDPGEGAMAAWQGAGILWQTLLSASQNTNGYGYGRSYYGSYGSGEGMRMALQDGLAGGGVTFVLFLVVLVVFVALAGFAGYAILRAIGRQKLMWAAIPALAVLFSGLLLFFGSNSLGRKPHMFAFAATDVSGSVSQSSRVIGLVAPALGRYRVSVEDARLLFPVTANNNYDYYMMQEKAVRLPVSAVCSAEGAEIEFLNVNLNGTRMIGFNTFSQQSPIEYSFVYDGSNVKCQIRNTSDWTIENFAIVLGGDFKLVGDLLPGAQEEILMQLDQTPPDQGIWSVFDRLYPYSYGGVGLFGAKPASAEQSMRGAFLREQTDRLMAGFGRNEDALAQALCIGWISKPFEHSIYVNGSNTVPKSLELIYAVSPVLQEDGNLQIKKVFGVLNNTLTTSRNAMMKGEYLMVEPGNTAVLDYDLAFPDPVILSGMTFESGSQQGVGMGAWNIYNWITQSWDAAVAKQRFNQDALANYINPEGLVRMRVAAGQHEYVEGTPYIWVQWVKQ